MSSDWNNWSTRSRASLLCSASSFFRILEQMNQSVVNHLSGDFCLFPAGEGFVGRVILIKILQKTVHLSEDFIPCWALVLLFLLFLSVSRRFLYDDGRLFGRHHDLVNLGTGPGVHAVGSGHGALGQTERGLRLEHHVVRRSEGRRISHVIVVHVHTIEPGREILDTLPLSPGSVL